MARHKKTTTSSARVAALVGLGYSDSDIASHLGINPVTLTTHYCKELQSSKIEAHVEVYEKMRERIRDGSDRLIEFYMRSQLRWRTADEVAEDAERQKAVREREEKIAALERSLQVDIKRDDNMQAGQKEESNGGAS